MNQKGFANIILIVLVVVLASALGYVTLVRKPTPVEQPRTNNLQNTQTTTPPTNNTVSQNQQTSCSSDTKSFLPQNAKLAKEQKVDFEKDGNQEVALVYHINFYPQEQYAQDNFGLIVLKCQAGKWNVAYNQAAERGSGSGMDVGVVSAQTTNGLFVQESWAGAGTTADWAIIGLVNGKLTKLERKPILDTVLEPRGYQFLGYNGAKVENNLIIETIPGYSKTAARCCPDKPGLQVQYKFTGTSIQVVNVKELAQPHNP